MSGPGGLPAPAAAISAAVRESVAAAADADLEAFEAATQRLADLDPEHVRVLMGHVVRALLEDQHLEGLTGDDVALVLERCVGSAAEWFPEVDPGFLVVVLTGALGIQDPEEDEPRPPGPVDIARHAAVLVADRLAVGGRPLDPYLDAAIAEVARAETVEMP